MALVVPCIVQRLLPERQARNRNPYSFGYLEGPLRWWGPCCWEEDQRAQQKENLKSPNVEPSTNYRLEENSIKENGTESSSSASRPRRRQAEEQPYTLKSLVIYHGRS